MDFVLIDESTPATATPGYGGALTSAALGIIAGALEVYANRDVATFHGGSYRFRVGLNSTDILAGEVACAILDSLPAVPGAVAYHDTTGAAVPVVFLARSQCTSVMAGSSSISAALSHEVAETIGDPSCNEWVDDMRGHEWAHELCDAVQEWGYTINGVAVSDFVLPAFFEPGAGGPYNFGALQGGPKLSAPFATAPGGYQIQRTSGGGEVQVTGQIAPHRLSKKAHWSSRTYRRGWRAMLMVGR